MVSEHQTAKEQVTHTPQRGGKAPLPRVHFSPWWVVGLGSLTLLVGLCGCQSEPQRLSVPASMTLRTVDQLAVVHQVGSTGQVMQEALPGATLASWRGDFARLVDDGPRAVRVMQWAIVQQEPAKAWRQPINRTWTWPDPQVLRIQALTPGDLTVTIIAWHEASDTTLIHVAVRVGGFGDAEVQTQFLAHLHRLMRGPAMPRRTGSFALPE